jgi:hypothetical protein
MELSVTLMTTLDIKVHGAFTIEIADMQKRYSLCCSLVTITNIIVDCWINSKWTVFYGMISCLGQFINSYYIELEKNCMRRARMHHHGEEKWYREYPACRNMSCRLLILLGQSCVLQSIALLVCRSRCSNMSSSLEDIRHMVKTFNNFLVQTTNIHCSSRSTSNYLRLTWWNACMNSRHNKA